MVCAACSGSLVLAAASDFAFFSLKVVGDEGWDVFFLYVVIFPWN